MNNKDTLQRFIFDNLPVRGELVHLNTSFNTILHQHDYPPFIRKLLGEALVAVSLLSAVIKLDGRVTLQFRGEGRLKMFMAQCNQDLHLRGLAQWENEFNEKDFTSDIQQGTLSIIMDPDIPNGRRYQGIVTWQANSLTLSIEEYFNHSEQLPTRLWLAIGEEQAAGLLLQVLPSDQDQQQDMAWEHLLQLTDTITPKELLTLDNEILLHRLYSQEQVRLFPTTPVLFRCTCSIERSKTAILLLGQKEIEEELKGKQQIEVVCEFCNKKYYFDRIDIAQIFNKGGEPPTSTQLH